MLVPVVVRAGVAVGGEQSVVVGPEGSCIEVEVGVEVGVSAVGGGLVAVPVLGTSSVCVGPVFEGGPIQTASAPEPIQRPVVHCVFGLFANAEGCTFCARTYV